MASHLREWECACTHQDQCLAQLLTGERDDGCAVYLIKILGRLRTITDIGRRDREFFRLANIAEDDAILCSCSGWAEKLVAWCPEDELCSHR